MHEILEAAGGHTKITRTKYMIIQINDVRKQRKPPR